MPIGTIHITAEAAGVLEVNWGLWVGVLVVYCCVTNHHTFRSLKQHTFMIPQFLRIRSPDMI